MQAIQQKPNFQELKEGDRRHMQTNREAHFGKGCVKETHFHFRIEHNKLVSSIVHMSFAQVVSFIFIPVEFLTTNNALQQCLTSFFLSSCKPTNVQTTYSY